MIGTTASPEKVELARANGCAHVLNSEDAGWEKQVREITGGKGVPVVYDSIGKDTFLAGLDCLAAARHHGDLWQCLGSGRSLLAVHPGGQGLAVRHPPDPGALHQHAAELQDVADDLFAVIVRRGEGGDQPALCAEGCGPGA